MAYSFECKDLSELIVKLKQGFNETEKVAMISHFNGNITIKNQRNDVYGLFSAMYSMVEDKEFNALSEIVNTIVIPNKEELCRQNQKEEANFFYTLLKKNIEMISAYDKNRNLVQFKNNMDVFELLTSFIKDMKVDFSRLVIDVYYLPDSLMQVKKDFLNFMIPHKSFTLEDRKYFMEKEDIAVLFKELEDKHLFHKLNENLANKQKQNVQKI